MRSLLRLLGERLARLGRAGLGGGQRAAVGLLAAQLRHGHLHARRARTGRTSLARCAVGADHAVGHLAAHAGGLARGARDLAGRGRTTAGRQCGNGGRGDRGRRGCGRGGGGRSERRDERGGGRRVHRRASDDAERVDAGAEDLGRRAGRADTDV